MERKRILFVCPKGNYSSGYARDFKRFLADKGHENEFEVSHMALTANLAAHGFDEQTLHNSNHIVAVWDNTIREITTYVKPPMQIPIHSFKKLLISGEDWKDALLKKIL